MPTCYQIDSNGALAAIATPAGGTASCDLVLLSGLEVQALTLAPAAPAVDWSQFDYAQAGAIWGFFFTVSMLCWWGGEQIGLMISALKAG